MPISVEPKVNLNDKERLEYHIREIRKILSKYPMATGFSHMATEMEHTKNASIELERRIKCLFVGEE